MSGPQQALENLRQAAAAGELRALCNRYGVRLLVVFGSALDPDASPGDLDIAVHVAADDADVLLFLLDELAEVAQTTQLDLMDLGRAGPVARERALVGGEPLFEEPAGTFARQQLAAIMERLDTDWLRRLDLERMAG